MQNPAVTQGIGPYNLSKKQVYITLGGIMLAMLLGALDQTVVGTSMPRIITDLGGFNKYTWVTSIYMITSAVTVPIAGKLSDMYGRKLFYLIGIAIFVSFSLACGLSQNMNELIVFRGLQGIGGGCLMTLAFIAIADLFSPQDRGKYQGLMTVVFSFASIIGPTIGGYLTDQVSWHWVFFINVPLGFIVFITFVKFFPNLQGSRVKHSIDFGGLSTLILTVAPIMLALSLGGVEYAWKSVQIIGLLVFAAIMLALFLFLETRAREPILPLSIFKNRIVAISDLVSFLSGMGMFGTLTFVPLFYQGVLGASATLSGNMQIPMSLAVMVTAFIAGQIISRKGLFRPLGILAMIMTCTGIFVLSRLNPQSAYWNVIIGTICIGCGMGFSTPTFTIAIQNSVPRENLGVATSSFTFLRSFGGSIGLAIMGSIVNTRFLSAVYSEIPQNLLNSIPKESLSSIVHNPQVLVNPAVKAQLEESLKNSGVSAGAYNQIMTGLHQALSTAITTAFLISFFILLTGLVGACFLKVHAQVKNGTQPGNNAQQKPE